MLWTRVATALAGIPILVAMIYWGGLWLLAGVFLLTLLGLIEIRRMLLRMGYASMDVFLLAGALLVPLLIYFQPGWAAGFLVLYLISGCVVYLARYPELTFADLALNVMSVVYVALGFSHLLLLRALPQGMFLVLYGFIVIWLTDSGAYFVGMAMGKNPFFQQISPKKTREGAWGGLILGTLGAFVFCQIAQLYLQLEARNILLWLAPLFAVADQMGDLFESALKRQARIKDSSRILPGHGGILDRFDSALWVMPLLYHTIVLYQAVIK